MAETTEREKFWKVTKPSRSQKKSAERERNPKSGTANRQTEKNGGSKKSIFAYSPRSKDIASEVIHADCVNHGYRLSKSIGEGAYAKVKLADVMPGKLARNQTLADIADETGSLQVAVKVIENRLVPREFMKKFLPRELQNHVPLPAHSNVVRVYEQFSTTERVYLVMEYCEKGDLLDLINGKIGENQKGIGEDAARNIFLQMTNGVRHIHSNNIAHRDLKCENILLDHNNDAKITDFGFSCRYNDSNTMLNTSCGSYAYTAPEVIKSKPYDGFRSDIWSMGVILFAMLNGRLPFNDSQLLEMEDDMRMQRLRFERTVSFDSMVLIRKILQYSPSQRPSIEEILEDPWITGKKPIPRQINRPKWVNPYEGRKEETKETRPQRSGATNNGKSTSTSLYYKAVMSERAQDSTVTVNGENRETITLKSRAGPKKNIWTSGPAHQQRPHTWPTQTKDYKTLQNNHRGSPRSFRKQNHRTSTSAKTGDKGDANTKEKKGMQHAYRKMHERSNVAPVPDCDSEERNKHISKWFLEKYLKKDRAEENKNENKAAPDPATGTVSKRLSSCGCDMEAVNRIKSMAKQHLSSDIMFEPVTPTEEDQSGRRLSPESTSTCSKRHSLCSNTESNVHTTNASNAKKSVTNVHRVKDSTENSPRTPTAAPSERCTSRAKDSRGSTPGTPTWSAEKSRNNISLRKVRLSSHAPSPQVKEQKPPESKSLDHCALTIYNAMAATSPATRVKHFREKLLELYGGRSKVYQEGNGLPPLVVQAIKPLKDKSSNNNISATPVANSDSYVTKEARNRTRGSRYIQGKTFQRVIFHAT